MSLDTEDPEARPPLEQRRTKASLPELIAIAKRAAKAVNRPYVDHGELLYDEHGLPK